ncbi:protein translocase subunit SecF [Gelria sp. Kuro-4]|uniref:protein translocase subunit SecF n=1 Tax=Gelria sp. Kuro-4 TaxID=2796927 RepID=UPI001BEDCF09|nr:protein translocase subunit SecF [Gelria sp. Kuro-4]MDI3522417.1 preprotein translocase subunit SecF [Bacillota bacterium]MDK2927057.1 preprotein translocase subunit SecF [Bacillota bacterium]BCV25214.1 protein-export membrane protein SecF [Gelria sp. Kuro-4]
MRIDFMGRSKLWIALSALVILIGLAALFLRGLNLGIDFEGGTLLQLRFEKTPTTNEIRTALADYGLQKSGVQLSGGNTALIRTRDLSDQERQNVLTGLKTKLGNYEILRVEKVGAVVSQELRNNAFLALTIASLLMLVYITLRFEFKFAVAGILALIHDVLITVGLFALFQVEIDSTFVAAILTIVGYSINDTIVVFDRIRENLKKRRKEPLAELVNTSIRETLTRSINTSLTTLFTVLALLFFGGETTKVFALAIFIGLTSGTYSSIFIASPIWYLWRRGELDHGTPAAARS